MSSPQKINILVVSDSAPTIDFFTETFKAVSRCEITCVPTSVIGEAARSKQGKPDLVFIDVDKGEILGNPELIAFRNRHRDVPLVILSEDLSDSDMRLLFRLNGNDWLKKPLERRPLIEVVAHQLANPGGPSTSKVHAVVSAVGGAGASVVAASLARVLCKAGKGATPRVNLFDLDFASGSQGIYLDLQNDYDLTQLLANPARVDPEFIDLVKKRHPAGFSLLSFRQPALNLSPKCAELVLRMLDVISNDSDHVVVDVPYYETFWKSQVLESVNSVYILTELNIPALRQARDLMNQVATLRGSTDSIFIVINKYRSKLFGLGVRKQQVDKIFANTGTHFIPDDWDTLTEALNRGILPSDVSERSGFSRAMVKLGALVK